MTTVKLDTVQLKRIEDNRERIVTARMLQSKHDDANDKLRNLLDKANNAADAASKGLTENLLNKISDAELEKLRIAAKKAEADFEYAKDIKEKLWYLVRQHEESDIHADTKHARELLLRQMFDAWLIEFKKDNALRERLAAGFELYGNVFSRFGHVGWQRFLAEIFGAEHNEQIAEPARAALIAKHKFLQD
ncbi:hypothetical protein [Nitrosomonas mobilis]|uniref:Uncharacterized protein n=1 Tax=Nitrosomonas mobilis TaxID=51642 RepID=A0A1G5SC66_9PROT|nr:hypothetical protein [Nitrosomonas mobilis]SCZ84785.1 hypothetical protein NSMM_260081 [Nitrosomonas mobilis]